MALAPVRPNVLIDEIQYALVICTATEATIFGVTKKGKDVEVYSTNLRAALSSPFTHIVCTNSGRLVALADDHDLYELHYGVSQGSWMSSSTTTASVTRRTGGGSWIRWGSKQPDDEYVRVTADPARGYIFAQKRNGALEMWDAEWQSIGVCMGVMNQVREDGRNMQVPTSDCTIVHIAPVRLEQSAELVLVAVAGFGESKYGEADRREPVLPQQKQFYQHLQPYTRPANRSGCQRRPTIILHDRPVYRRSVDGFVLLGQSTAGV